MRTILAIFFILTTTLSYAQFEDKVREVESMPNDTAKVDALVELAKDYMNAHIDSSRIYAEKAKTLATKLKYERGLISLDLVEGNFFYYEGNLPEAKAKFQNVEREATKKGYPTLVAGSKLLLGNVYAKSQEFENALKTYREGVAVCMRDENYETASSIYVSIGIVKRMMGELDSALYYYESVLKMQEENIHDSIVIAAIYNNMGAIYYHRRDLASTEEYILKAIDINRKTGNVRFEMINLANLGSIWAETGVDLDKSISYLNLALELAMDRGALDDIYHFYDDKALILYHHGKYKEAFDNLQLSNSYKDSVFNSEKQAQLLELEKQYETQQIQDSLRMSEQDLDLAQANEEAANQKADKAAWQLVGSIVLTLLILVVLFFVYRNSKNQKRINAVLSDKNDEINHQKEIIQEKNTELTDSITYAKRIQAAILPSNKLINEVLPDSFVLYLPKDIVAGDFYWLQKVGNRIIFAVADCTGHGVPGAMVSVVCNNALNRSVREFGLTDPAKILDKTREIVVQEFEKSDDVVKDGMDISLVSMEIGSKEILWAGANNPLYIARESEEEMIEIKGDKQPIGDFQNATPFSVHILTLQAGDVIYLASDGYADQFGGEKAKKFKSSNFKKLLRSVANDNLSTQKDALNKRLNDWRGEIEQLDDICVIGVRF